MGSAEEPLLPIVIAFFDCFRVMLLFLLKILMLLLLLLLLSIVRVHTAWRCYIVLFFSIINCCIAAIDDAGFCVISKAFIVQRIELDRHR